MKLIKNYNVFPIDIDCDDSHYLRMIYEFKYRYESNHNYNAITGCILIAEYKVKNRLFNLEMSGESVVFNPENDQIKMHFLFKEYHRRDRMDELFEKSIPVLRLYEQKESPMVDFHGAFYSISDVENYLKDLV